MAAGASGRCKRCHLCMSLTSYSAKDVDAHGEAGKSRVDAGDTFWASAQSGEEPALIARG